MKRPERRLHVAAVTPPPTRIGDVLILQTNETFTAYLVGAVWVAGQTDFRRAPRVQHVATGLEALSVARSLVDVDGRIYLLNIDTGHWSELPAEHASELDGPAEASTRSVPEQYPEPFETGKWP